MATNRCHDGLVAAMTASSLASISLDAGATATTDTLEVRATACTWGDWQPLSATRHGGKAGSAGAYNSDPEPDVDRRKGDFALAARDDIHRSGPSGAEIHRRVAIGDGADAKHGRKATPSRSRCRQIPSRPGCASIRARTSSPGRSPPTQAGSSGWRWSHPTRRVCRRLTCSRSPS